MTNQSQAFELRTKLGLTPTEAGVQLLGYKHKAAYDTWSRWETGEKIPNRPTRCFFKVLLILVDELNGGDEGVEHALGLVLEGLKDGD